MKRTIALIILSCMVPASYATPTWTSGIQTVTNIIWIPGYHGFYASGATFHDPQNCGGASAHLYLLDPALDEKTVDRLYAMLMTAGATSKTVFAWVDGCIGTSPKILGLQINN
jgi:hypothetical protein